MRGVPPAAELIGLLTRGLTQELHNSVCYQPDDTILYHI